MGLGGSKTASPKLADTRTAIFQVKWAVNSRRRAAMPAPSGRHVAGMITANSSPP